METPVAAGQVLHFQMRDADDICSLKSHPSLPCRKMPVANVANEA
jgi:hypothetical protein